MNEEKSKLIGEIEKLNEQNYDLLSNQRDKANSASVEVEQ